MPVPRDSARAAASLLVLALLAFPLTAAAAAAAESDEQVLAELLAINHDLEEAIRLGDKSLLQRHALPEMLLVNRDGKVYDLQGFLDDLVAPRPGYDLRFTPLEPRLLRHGDTAVLTYLLDEYLTIYGVDVSTQYRTNLVFFRRDGSWKLAFYEYFEKPVDPRVHPLDPAEYDQLAGTYEIGPGHWVTRIRRDGDRLFSRRDQGPERELVPLAPDRFFYPGAEGELFFERDATGRVTGMRFRRNFKDVPYYRLPDEPAG